MSGYEPDQESRSWPYRYVLLTVTGAALIFSSHTNKDLGLGSAVTQRTKGRRRRVENSQSEYVVVNVGSGAHGIAVRVLPIEPQIVIGHLGSVAITG